jgi:hypothetical protein
LATTQERLSACLAFSFSSVPLCLCGEVLHFGFVTIVGRNSTIV